MSCAGRHHLAKRSEATRDYTDTNWEGTLNNDETVAVVEADLGNGVLKVRDLIPGASSSSTENNNNTDDDSNTHQIQVPGKFHKLIWFLRNDIVVHDGHGTLVRKVSDEQLRRLAKEQPESAFAPAWEIQASRFDKRSVEDKEKELLDRRPNWAARVVHTGFTSSDDDEEGEGEEYEEEEEAASEE